MPEYIHLCMLVLYHRFRYYVLADSAISDTEYDEMEKRLEEMENEHPEMIHPDSPIGRVGCEDATQYPRSILHACKTLPSFAPAMERGGWQWGENKSKSKRRSR